jgi:hypothetical protein
MGRDDGGENREVMADAPRGDEGVPDGEAVHTRKAPMTFSSSQISISGGGARIAATLPLRPQTHFEVLPKANYAAKSTRIWLVAVSCISGAQSNWPNSPRGAAMRTQRCSPLA